MYRLATVNMSCHGTESGRFAKGAAERATRRHDTQHEAIDAAREIARKQRTEVYVHGRDGRIRERNSYGNDAFPPEG